MTFEYGIASGDVTETSVVLWTRSTRPVITWELEGVGLDHRSSGHGYPDADGFLHVPIAGLQPGASWRYRFSNATDSSAWGRFRTLPAGGPVRFAVVSCAKFNSGYFNAYEAVSRRDDLDFVLHLGDYIYEAAQVPRGHQTPGVNIGRPFDPVHDCVTADDYRRRYAQYRSDPALRRLHENHALLFTLDDHEIADNAWAGGAEEHHQSDGPWETRLRNALTAWEQWQPTTRNPSTGEALWQTSQLGGVATLFLCDSRLQRTDPFATDGPEKWVLGPEQSSDLESLMVEASRPWLIIGMPSKFMSLNGARGDADTDLVMKTLKLSDTNGAPFHDRWDAYAHERDRLQSLLESSPSTPVLLCGDVHFAAFSQTLSGRVAECVTSSVTSPNFDDKRGWPHGDASRPYEEKLVDRIPELEWCDLDRHGYLLVEVSEEQFTCEWWAVPTVLQPSAEAELLHRVVLTRTSSR